MIAEAWESGIPHTFLEGWSQLTFRLLAWAPTLLVSCQALSLWPVSHVQYLRWPWKPPLLPATFAQLTFRKEPRLIKGN